MIELGINETNLDTLIGFGTRVILAKRWSSKVIADVAANSTVKTHRIGAYAFTQLHEKYGYDKFDGTCHVVPNHGLIILSAVLWTKTTSTKR
ncbi:hypothetical protein O9929_12600 [Vibrio lentus]|nr:hypothetical protein [Vibrio lentus]